MDFSIAPDHPALEGHFPGQPIVPAVVILDAVLAAAGQLDQRNWDALSAAGREAAFALYQAGHYALLADDPDAD